MSPVQPLTVEQLCRYCDPDQFSFQTTDELDDFHEIIGQQRAVEAVRFGIGMKQDGYNIFALGPAGSGKRSLVQKYFEQQAKEEPTPFDWCYVYNFEQDYRPRAINLPAGMGSQFQVDMKGLLEELRTVLSSAFESDEYRARRQMIEEEFQERQEKAFEEIQKQAQERGMALLRTPGGIVFAPMRNGEVMPPEEFQKLSIEERQRLEKNVEYLQQSLQQILQKAPIWQREMRERIKSLNQEFTTLAVGGLIDELRQKYQEYPTVLNHLNAVQKDIVENAADLIASEESPGEGSENSLAAWMARARLGLSPSRRYQVNLLVDHKSTFGAPVIYEDNPTYQNLIGRVEHIAQMGALVTDFNLIKPGSLHLANGGYLIIDARKLLQQPYAYEGLKRALQSRKIYIEPLGQMLSLISTVSLEPEPIPLNVKVALLGDRLLYYLLKQYDPDFSELFKVQADFEDQMDRSTENQNLYGQLIATFIRKDGLKPFDKNAVGRVIDYSARMAEDTEKLSAQMHSITSLLREANYWADLNGNSVVTAEDVQKAIDAKTFRANRVHERIKENILRETILIDTTGEKVGQINGLSVIQLGDYAFGIPSRITARVRMGKGEVVNIEREVELSGPIHSKGVLILSSFLGARYAAERPFSLSANLVFEQSYSSVEGDSASAAELYALLSAIAEVPIRQSLAVTGSVNQHGQVQAIGGVNEKIEGFFDICKQRGLTGDQGVIIPKSNVKNLMLRRDVIEAVRAGQFHIYPIEAIDQGIEILTGIPAGDADENGNYPEDSFNGKVQNRLIALAEKRAEYDQKAREEPK